MSEISREEKMRILEVVGKQLETMCINYYTPIDKNLLLGKFSSKVYSDVMMHVGNTCYKFLRQASDLRYFKLIVERKPLWDFYSEYKFKLYIRFYSNRTDPNDFKCIKQVLQKPGQQLCYQYYRYAKYITDLFLLKMILEPKGYMVDTAKESYYYVVNVYQGPPSTCRSTYSIEPSSAPVVALQ